MNDLLWAVLAAILLLLAPGGFAQTTIHPDDLAALRVVADSLQISSNFWDFSVDPCSGANGWNNTSTANEFNTPTAGIECSCGNTTCRVTRIVVVSMNVRGRIPPEIGNFTFLNDLNLGQNVITGRIPDEVGLLSNLQYFTVGINKLSGPLPASIGKLTKLVSIGFGSNDLSGTLPREIGNMQSLLKMYMDSCGLGGEMPKEFGNLTKLETLWMAGNNFNGTFPDFFGNLVNLQDVKMHGNNFQGPIPASLGNLVNAKIIDLGDISSGGVIPASFNRLSGVTKLILRNCDLTGTIPDLSNLTSLVNLDLSLNNLNGTIPAPFWSFPSLQILLLGSNQLSGQLPSQISSSIQRVDVSYNELSGALPAWVNSLQTNVIWNRFNTNNTSTDFRVAASNCLQSRANCSTIGAGRNFRFAVNCGGPQITSSSGTVFNEDSRAFTMGTFYSSQAWVVSATGYSDGIVNSIENTTVTITGTVDPRLYQTSRSAPSSLRYLGLGMISGLYNLELHFAEIRLDNSSSWVGNSRRLFDVYIQGNQVLKDFNIQNLAGASYRALRRSFNNVSVNNSVLDIHFLWKGKGTCCYGPLISAIQVSPVFSTAGLEPELSGSKSSSGVGIGVGVGVGILALIVVLLALFLVWRRRLRLKSTLEDEEDFRNMEGKPDLFSYNEMKIATRGFAPENKLGQGGFGAVYKGTLANGTVVAIKELASKSQQGSREFLNEVTIISSVQHRNLVKLHGCCIEGNHRLLVYEFLENNSLHHVLLSSKAPTHILDWPTRFRICVGVARGIAYLHEDSRPKIVHRDIKASNVLLDKSMNPKIADFGLAKLFQDQETHVSTRVAGTMGYLSPEYAMRGQLTEKADVYSFGVLALEIVSGRSNLNTGLPNDMVYLLEYAWDLYEKNRVLEILDPEAGDAREEEVLRVIQVALLCSQAIASARPIMSHVVAMLVGTAPVDVSALKPGYFSALKDAAPGFFFSDSNENWPKHKPQVSAVQSTTSVSTSSSHPFSSSSTIPSDQEAPSAR